MECAIRAFEKAKKLVQPEYTIVEEKIEAWRLTLILKPTHLDGIGVEMNFGAESCTNDYGYSGSIDLELEEGKFKNRIVSALKHQPYTFCWTEWSKNSKDSKCSYSRLIGYIKDLKDDLLVASRLKKKQ